MATSATIHSIGAWRPPTRSNTIKGSRYLRRESRLTPAKRRQLRALEDTLLDGLARCEDCMGALDRPERLHEIPGEGYITYFYSRVEQYYVLSDFGFDDSGTGGMPCTQRAAVGVGGCGERAGRRRAAGGFRAVLRTSVDRIENLVASLLAMMRPVTCHWPFVAERRSQELTLRVHHISAVSLANDVLQTHALLAGTGPVDRADLPTWSVLRDVVLVSEELRNPLARSIMAGELVCRLGSAAEVAWRSIEHRQSSRWRFLMSATTPGRDDVADSGAEQWEPLMTAWLAGSDRVGPRERLDVRARLLARAKLSMLLSAHVGRATADALAALDDGGRSWLIEPRRHLVLTKMHLMTEYLALSYCLTDNHAWNAERAREQFVDEQLPPRDVVVFEEFDRTVEIIAKEVHGTGNKHSDNAPALHAKIAGLVRQILDTSGSGGVPLQH